VVINGNILTKMKITLYLLTKDNITPHNFEMGGDYDPLIDYCEDKTSYYEQTEEEFIGTCGKFLFEQECMDFNMQQEQTLILTEAGLDNYTKLIFNIYSNKVGTK
jgi:hypothetical protein